MMNPITEALRGVVLAYTVVDPEHAPQSIPVFQSNEDTARAISLLREYAEVCRTSLDICGVPIDVAPEIARAGGILDGYLFAYEQARLSKARTDRQFTGEGAAA